MWKPFSILLIIYFYLVNLKIILYISTSQGTQFSQGAIFDCRKISVGISVAPGAQFCLGAGHGKPLCVGGSA